MGENRPKIKAAEKATDVVIDHWNNAQSALRRLWTNGYGVLSDPSMARSDLYRAQDEIKAALAALNGCAWPSDKDYGDA
jgi:hypothetical protein